MGSVNLEAEAAKRRLDVVEWLNEMLPDFNLSPEASEEELRARLLDCSVFCRILRRMNPGYLEGQSDCLSPEQRMESFSRFVLAIDEIGLPTFKVSDLEQGPMSRVIACLLCLRDRLNSSNGDGWLRRSLLKCRSQPVSRSNGMEVDIVETTDVSQGENALGQQNFTCLGEEKKQNLKELRSMRILRSPLSSAPSSPLSHQAGHTFHEVFQLKQGRYSDLPAARISEMLKSNSLDSAPTQSLLIVVNGILDEKIERKDGEISQHVACLLRKVVQEIERRISTQAEHIRNQNNLIKSREQKYQSRIRVLETLATGTSEQTKIIINQLRVTKAEKDKIEEEKKLGDLDVVRLRKEKEISDHMILELQQDLEMTRRSHEQQCQLLEVKATRSKVELEEKTKEFEFLLAESRVKTKELEELSEAKSQTWNRKQYMFQNFIGSQIQSVQELRLCFESIKSEITNNKTRWSEELNSFGLKLKELTDAAENYHNVLVENRRLFNEVQELKGNIRVHCRIRPFLSGENKHSTTIDYIGENGDLVLENPSKQGNTGHRTFKFNKVFGPAATQEEVYLDIQPLVRSVLDGYNVCIFAYGQTGSGKTYTMTGPNLSSKEDWGVNYRALYDLFNISRNRKSTIIYEVGVQMVEIYNEQVRDLLADDASQKNLGVRNASQPNGLAVPNASMHHVTSTSDVLQLMQIGLANRAVSATALNERSSRSHSIVTIHVRGNDVKTGATLRGSLHLVDLAGSERIDRSEVTGDRLKEAQHINKSLSSLGDVIFALSQKSAHVPYRNSKLTQVLQSSLGGHAKTLMFVQINPDVKSYSETSSTLKFAERVSGVELGAAKSNKDRKDVRELMEQMGSLKDTLVRKDAEIKHLKLFKGSGCPSPGSKSERLGRNSLRHSSSSPRLPLIGVDTKRRLSGGKFSKSKAVSDNGIYSDHSDKHSDASSQHSFDDFKHQKENIGQPKWTGVDTKLPLIGVDTKHRLSGGKFSKNKAVSDNGIYSDHSDKHSDASSQHSFDDFKHQKENVGQPKWTGLDTKLPLIGVDTKCRLSGGKFSKSKAVSDNGIYPDHSDKHSDATSQHSFDEFKHQKENVGQPKWTGVDTKLPLIGVDTKRRLYGGKFSKSKAVSDNGIYPDHSDKHSDASSRHSFDDFKHQKENVGQPKWTGEDSSQSSYADLELLCFGDADSEERLSDISDGGLSMGAETDGTIELTLFPENGKTAEVKKEKMLTDSTKIEKPTPQKVGQTTVTQTK